MPRTLSAAPPRVVLAIFTAIAIALALALWHGSELHDFLTPLRRARTPLRWALAGLFLACVAGLAVRRRAFGTRPADRLLAAGSIVAATGLALVDAARMIVAKPTGIASQLFSTLALSFATPMCAGVLFAWIAEGRRRAVAAFRLAGRLAFSFAFAMALLAPIEEWAVPRQLSDWYGVVALDGGEDRLHEPDPVLHWRMRPGFRGRLVHPEFGGTLIETNSLGFRDREFEDPPVDGGEAGRGLGIVLGDSFSFGLGLAPEEALSARLERAGAAPRAFNAGVCGYGTFDQLVLLDRLASRYRPGFVVIQFYPGNDLEENLGFLRRAARDSATAAAIAPLVPDAAAWAERAAAVGYDAPALTLGAPDHTRWRRYAQSRSCAARALFDVFDRFVAARGGMPRGAPSNSMLVRSLLEEPDEEVALAVEVTRVALLAARARSEAIGTRLVVCLVPARIQVDESLLSGALSRTRRAWEDRLDPDRPQSLLARACAEEGIECVDLTAEFRERVGRGEKLYFAEGHWRAEGVEIAARAIAARLDARSAAAREGTGR